MDLVAVLLGGERVEEQAAVGQGVDEVLVRQHGHPFDLEQLTLLLLLLSTLLGKSSTRIDELVAVP